MFNEFRSLLRKYIARSATFSDAAQLEFEAKMPENIKQPKYLNLAEIRLPLAGFVSILHRISGAGLFLLLPLLLYLLQLSLGTRRISNPCVPTSPIRCSN